MIYQGDNWPAEFRNRLFTHNLHGHQMNQQINRREAGGYNTIHAGFDMLFCSDQQYIGVDLQYGPDGAVYISDWYDPRHCHNPNAEQWDRSNGRIYRMKYNSTWKPAHVDYTKATDDELVAAHRHENEWHVRIARLELSGRASRREIAKSAVAKLEQMALSDNDPASRLKAIWTLHGINKLSPAIIKSALEHSSEYVRAWGIQLGVEITGQSPADGRNRRLRIGDLDLGTRLVSMAESDDSLFVRRYLASAVDRTGETGWQIAVAICDRPDSSTDRDLPPLLWHSLAGLVLSDIDRAFQLAETTEIPAIADDIYWYAAANSDAAREKLLTMISQQEGRVRRQQLATLQFAVRDARNLKVPDSWKSLSDSLYSSEDQQVANSAEAIGTAFGDETAFRRVRQRVASGTLDKVDLLKSLRMLSSDSSAENLPVYLKLVSDKEAAGQVIPLLARFNSPAVAEELLKCLPQLQAAAYSSAMEALCSRTAWANLILDRIADGTLPKSHLTAFYARQMASLGDPALKVRLEKEWGRLGQSSSELKSEVSKLATAYKTAPLWAYSDDAGALHFKKLCAQCHLPNGQSSALGPKLTGSGAKGVEYVVENVLDPNAVVGRDYQSRIIQTTGGRVLSGLIEKESETSVTIRTLNDSITIAKSEIEETKISDNSFMPEGLLKTLSDREKIELLKYLMRQ